MTSRVTDKDKANLLTLFRSSPLSQTKFCEQHNISKSTFSNWLAKGRKESPNCTASPKKVSFVQAKVDESLPQEGVSIKAPKYLKIFTSYGRIEVPL